MNIIDKTMHLLERSLDLRGARQKVIAANIANEETPRYRATELNFGEALASAQRGKLPITLVSTHPTHIGPKGDGFQRVTGRIEEVGAGDLPLDANTVNIELEMAKMSDNAMQYNTAATIISMRFRSLLAAIREGR
ncbi:MAG: flagellar basal body rod protein FlgB [Nitrospiraceae bacterium]|nr:flagellar basal body rod protein FlgB [Nitrospiraceae bacterium]